MGDLPIESLREGSQLEVKLAKNGVPASVWETYSAFANTDGGTIILGAVENAEGIIEYVGVPHPDQLAKKFWDGVNNPSKVSANILTSDSVAIETTEDRSIVRIKVPRASRILKPVFISGKREQGTYRRNGEGDYRCSSEEVLAMIRDASNEPLDDAVLEEFSLDALSRESVERYRTAVAAVRPNHPWLTLEYEEFLVKLNAIRRAGGEGVFHPTRAGLLMFGIENEITREYANFFLDYREVGGGSRWADRVMSQDGTWSGNVFDFWVTVLPKLSAALKRPFALGNNLQRIEDTDMHAAIREAFVNALVHADYHGRRGIVALRKNGRIEISNPGTSRVALDVLKAGGVSDARNPTMMKMFGLISACERTGSGFDVMKKAAEASGAIPPEVRQQFEPDRIEVVLHLGQLAPLMPSKDLMPSKYLMPGLNYVYKPADDMGESKQPSSKLRHALSHDLTKIVEMGRDKESFTRRDVEAILSCGPTKAKSLINELLNMGLLKTEGLARGTRYRLT